MPSHGSLRSAALLAAILGPWLTACPGGGSQGPSVDQAGLPTVLAHADGAFRDGDYQEAQRAYEQALTIEADQPQAVAGLGTCYLKNRLVKKADDLLSEHLKRHPENTAARLVLARTLLREGELEKAAAELRLVLAADPRNLMAHYNLGFIAYRTRHNDEALQELKAAIALRPDHPEAHYTLGLTYMALGQNDLAVGELQQAIRIDPKHVGAHFNLAKAAALAGRMDLAGQEQRAYAQLSGLGKAEAERAAQAKASSLKAVEFLMAEDYPHALGEYQKLVAQFPDYAPLYNDLGRVQLKLGQKQEAVATLRRAVEIDPRLSEPHYLLSNLYRDMGDQAAAAREIETFAALETIPEGKSGY